MIPSCSRHMARVALYSPDRENYFGRCLDKDHARPADDGENVSELLVGHHTCPVQSEPAQQRRSLRLSTIYYFELTDLWLSRCARIVRSTSPVRAIEPGECETNTLLKKLVLAPCNATFVLIQPDHSRKPRYDPSRWISAHFSNMWHA